MAISTNQYHWPKNWPVGKLPEDPLANIFYTARMNTVINQAKRIHGLLSGAGIEHVLLGDTRISGTGNPRFNDDLDFVVGGSNRLTAKNCLIERGFRVWEENPEVCKLEGASSVDLIFAHDALFREFLNFAQALGTTDLKYLGTEGVIALKIQTYVGNPERETNELRDIANLLERSGDINWSAIKVFADLFKQWPRIESIKGVATKVIE